MNPSPFWNGQHIVAQRKHYMGAPTIFVNGKPLHGGGVAFRDGEYGPPAFRNIDPELVMPDASVVVGPDAVPDYQHIRKWLEDILKDHPGALGGCILNISASREWVEAHPDEMIKYEPEVDFNGGAQRDPSLASDIWRKDSALFIERLSSHLHDYFDGRIILYQVGGGSCGENGPLSDPYYSGKWYISDFSGPMLSYFRRKLREYYSGDIDQLRRAWGNPDVDFENAQIPGRVERMKSEYYSFRASDCCQTGDYYRAWSEAVEECALGWMEAVKRGTNNESLTATPIGSILDVGLCSYMVHQLAKNSYKKALQSPYVDFMESPASYCLRDPGKGDTSSMIPIGNARLAGKSWLRDFDSRTSLVATVNEEDPVGSLWRTPKTPWQDTQILIRDCAYSIMTGGSFWWHEINDGMYSLPEHIQTAKRMQSVGRAALHADRSLAAGMGVFVDHYANFYQSNSNRLIYAMNYEPRQLHWPHSGMAYDAFHIDDISHPDLPKHKLLMVTNAFMMSDEQATAFIDFARENESTIIWMIAPGVMGRNGFDLDRTSRITGFNIRMENVEANPRISTLTSGFSSFSPDCNMKGIPSYFGTGSHDTDDSGERSIGPLFYADTSQDSDAIVLGMLDALAEPGFTAKKMDGYTSIYCSAPYLPNEILRCLGRKSGAHIYLDTDDLIHICNNLILIHAKQAGNKTISWPDRVDIAVDLFTGEEIGNDLSELNLYMEQYETRFIFAGPLQTSMKVREQLT